ncbi:hypothetical protein Micbo1qcDRAFT_173431 [Microdochium bolleyi]|uniref:Uncharacterized protein n=1 Tax=Microdochium bolleyi TaxID=196109 RepID=A0A136JBX5_9PEZI|nr:hypothetical protein Micbo1qcDRAFT_173431 [Microdochium bolleyi]
MARPSRLAKSATAAGDACDLCVSDVREDYTLLTSASLGALQLASHWLARSKAHKPLADSDYVEEKTASSHFAPVGNSQLLSAEDYAGSANDKSRARMQASLSPHVLYPTRLLHPKPPALFPRVRDADTHIVAATHISPAAPDQAPAHQVEFLVELAEGQLRVLI